MAQMVHHSIDYYTRLMENGDSRVSSWPMMGGPMPTISACLCYVFLVKVLGPRMMKNREPLNIRWFMVSYNFFMVLVSFYIFTKLGIHGWFGKYNYKCQPVDYSNSRDATAMAHLAWWYYISKFVEFFDTIFFVLRKKYTHISTLHVIHHGVMPMSVWWGVKFTPGGHSTFFAFINSFIHILMYIYYGLAAIGPQTYKYLWWKKYMTSIQMVQFVLIFVHSFQLLFRDCNYPRGFMWWIGFHAILFWFLFWDFYKNAYLKKKSSSASRSVAAPAGPKAATHFLACSDTEKMLNGMNGRSESPGRELLADSEGNLIRRKKAEDGKETSYSSTVKNGLSDSSHKNGAIKGKDL